MKRRIGMMLGSMVAVLGLLSPEVLGQTKMTLCASWTIYGWYAPVVAGLERGTFKAEGLEVNFLRGYGSGDTFKRVATGACDYGDAAAGPAALGRVRGIKAKLFSMVSAKNQESLYFFEGSGIKGPKDLEGKRITGGPKAAANTMMWPVFARANRINPDKVQLIYMEPGAQPASLGAGRVDAVIDYHSLRSGYDIVAAQTGKKLVVLFWAEHGLDLYSNGLVASDETLEKRKDLSLRFLKAFYEAHIWAFRNREAVVDLFMKQYPEQKREVVQKAQDLFFFHLFDKNTDKEGFGYLNKEKLATTIRVTLEASGVKETLEASDLYTNEFVDQLPKDLLFFFKK